jgi:hypothetical protein
MSLSSMELDPGALGPCKVMDKAVGKHCDNAHEGDVARCQSHELMANGSTHSIVHHLNMQANGLIPMDKNPVVKVHFHYYDKGDPEPCINNLAYNQTITQPIFSCFSNSYLRDNEAVKAFDFTGGGDGDIGDSQYGQGINMAAHGLSADNQCMMMCYNGMIPDQREGTVSLYKIMDASNLTAESTHSHHGHLTCKFYVDDDGEVQWLNRKGDMSVAPKAKQETLNILFEQSFLFHQKKNLALDRGQTGMRLENIIKEHVVKPAEAMDAKAGVLLLFTGKTWADSPPMQKISKVVRGQQVDDLMCRTKNGEVSLGKLLLKEWPDLAITTSKLQSGTATCYDREVRVQNWNIEDLGTRDATLDWQIEQVEKGMSKGADNPAHTRSVTIHLSSGKCALLRMTVHPDARNKEIHQTYKKGYMKRENAPIAEGKLFAGGYRVSGGPVLYNSRVLGTIPELGNGVYTRLQKNSGMTGSLPLENMMNNSMQQNFIESVVDVVARKLGCNPSLNGEYSDADHDLLEGIIRGGINTIYTILTPQSKGGIKPKDRIDLIPKIFGYDVVSTLELDCLMAPNKIQMQSADDSQDLLVGMFQEQLKFFFDHDPLGVELMEKVNSPDFKQAAFKPRSSGAGRPMSAPATLAERRARNTTSTKTPAQREAHRINDRVAHEDRIEDAPTFVNQHTKFVTTKLLGAESWDAVEARPPAGPTSIEAKLRVLCSHANGLANITLDAKAASTRGRWMLFAMMQVAEFIGKAEERPTPEQLNIMNELWFKASLPLKKSAMNDKQLGRPSKPKATKKRPRASESGAAGPSSGAAERDEEDELVPRNDNALPPELRELLPGDTDWRGGSFDPMLSSKRTRPSEGAMGVDAEDKDDDEEYKQAEGAAPSESEVSDADDE